MSTLFIDHLVNIDYIVSLMKAKCIESGKSRRQKRVIRTRRRLKAAALGLFSAKSVDAATIEQITAKADLGKGTLYQHIEDKEEISIIPLRRVLVRSLVTFFGR